MLNVLIVDDQESVRAELVDLLQRIDSDIRNIYEAENGKTALDKLLLVKPHIIFLDMVMPIMDGYEFLNKVRDYNQNMHVIVLSAYKDFFKVKYALQHKVDNYLLKPVKQNELKETLINVKMDIFGASAKRRVNEIYYGSLLHEFITGRDIFINIEGILKGTNHNWNRSDYFSVFLIALKDNSNCKKIEAFLNTTLAYIGLEYIVYSTGVNIVLIVNLGEDAHADIQPILGTISSIPAETFCGYSESFQNYCNLPEGYMHAQSALLQSMCGNDSNVCKYSFPSGNAAIASNMEIIDEISTYIMQSNKEQLGKSIKNLFDSLLFHINNDAELRYFIKVSMYKIFNYINDIFINSIDYQNKLKTIRFDKLLDSVRRSHNQFEIKVKFREFINQISAIVDDINSCDDRNRIIDFIIEYIHENYANDINVTRISNELSMNYSYISNLFSQKKGVTISNYLTKYRLKKAYEALSIGTEKIHDIAKNTGFKDAKYFCKVFKKYYGVQPSEIRKRR